MERYIIKANKIIARDQLEVMENSGLLIENGKYKKYTIISLRLKYQSKQT